MTAIDPRQALHAALREKLEPPRAGAGRTDTARIAARRSTGTLAQRIQCLSPDDPHRPRKAVRLFLEARITRELGTQLVNDAAFGLMLDAIQCQLEQDAETAAAVQALGEWLCAGGSA